MSVSLLPLIGVAGPWYRASLLAVAPDTVSGSSLDRAAALVGLSGGGLDTDGSGESAADDLSDAEVLELPIGGSTMLGPH
jgi:hypothetical protein